MKLFQIYFPMLNKIFAYYKIAVVRMFEGKMGLIIWIIVNLAYTFSSSYLWFALTKGEGSVGSLKSTDLITYYIYMFILWYIIGGTFAWSIEKNIKEGTLSNQLLKPQFSFLPDILWEQGWKSVGFLFSLPLIVLMFAFTIGPFEISFDILSFFMSIPSIIMGGVIFGCFQLLTGLSALWLESSHGVDKVYRMFSSFLGGKLIPLAIMPESIKLVAYLTPFRYIFSFPVEIFQQQIDGSEIVSGYLLQIMWLVILIIACRIAYIKGLKRYESFGN